MDKVYFRFFDNRISKISGFQKDMRYKFLNFSSVSTVTRHKMWSNVQSQSYMVRNIENMSKIIEDNDYVLCPFYETPKDRDFQFGITETKKFGESDLQYLKRGLSEELGLRYSDTCVPEAYIGFKQFTKNFKMYLLNINDSCLKPVLKTKYPSEGKDDKYSKIAAVVYGKESDILDFLDRDKILTDENEDVITGIVAMKYKYFKKRFNS